MFYKLTNQKKRQKKESKKSKKLEKHYVTNKINSCKYKTITILSLILLWLILRIVSASALDNFYVKNMVISTVQYELSNRYSKNVSVGAPVWNVSVFGVFLFHIFPRLVWNLVIFQDFLSRVCTWINSRLWKQKIYRSSRPDASVKKMLFKISQNSQENTCARVSFLIKFIKKDTLA